MVEKGEAMMVIVRYRVVPPGTPDYGEPPHSLGDLALPQATAFMWGIRAADNGGVRWATDYVLMMGKEDALMPPMSPFGTLPKRR